MEGSNFFLPCPAVKPEYFCETMEDLKDILKQLKDLEALKFRCELAEEERARLDAIVSLVEDAIIGIAPDGTIITWNSGARKIYGYSADEVLGRPISSLSSSAHPDDIPCIMSKIAGGDSVGNVETTGKRKDGRPVRISLGALPLKDAGGRVIGFVAIARDISQSRPVETARNSAELPRSSLSELQAIYAAAPFGLCFVDTALRYVSVNQRLSEMNGLPVEDHIGRTVGEEVPLLADISTSYLRRAIETGEPVEGLEIRGAMRTQPGGERDWLLYAHPVRDEFARILGLNVVVQEITERKRVEETMRFRALHDPLTDLPNRMLFMDHLNLRLAEARRSRKALAVMFLDLDNFKNVNDTFGHLIGDKLIREVADRLKTSVRETDTVARIGGDEFIMLAGDIDQTRDAASVAEKIMALFEEPFVLEHHEILVTASMGISVCPDDDETAEALLKKADIAMYHAKERGRNNYQFYGSTANIRTFERMLLEINLRRMIENGELILHYQPQINMDTRQICCAEALVRWQHPELGLLGPARFLPTAEEVGAITFIDEWVLRSACAQTRAWHAAGYQSIGVSVNISARQFQRSNTVKMISGILQETGLAPEFLDLDISEKVVMQNMESAVATLGKLADIGVGVSVDEFGSGFLCLSYLRRLPARKIKIDRSLIRALKEDTAHQAMVNAVIAVAHKMNLHTVGVGVETDEQFDFLHSSGCDEMQGNLYSGPLSNESFERLVVTRR